MWRKRAVILLQRIPNTIPTGWSLRTNCAACLVGTTSARDVINILDPQASSRKSAPAVVAEKATRRPRSQKVYKNPHNGEVVETKVGNHKTLEEWKGQYCSEEV
jgi:hypothetical protein